MPLSRGCEGIPQPVLQTWLTILHTHIKKKIVSNLYFLKSWKWERLRWGGENYFNNPHRPCGVLCNLLHCFPMKLLKKSRAPHDGGCSGLKIKWPSDGVESSHMIKRCVCVCLAAVLLDNFKHVRWYFLVWSRWTSKSMKKRKGKKTRHSSLENSFKMC